jgi:hypothetical protein
VQRSIGRFQCERSFSRRFWVLTSLASILMTTQGTSSPLAHASWVWRCAFCSTDMVHCVSLIWCILLLSVAFWDLQSYYYYLHYEVSGLTAISCM